MAAREHAPCIEHGDMRLRHIHQSRPINEGGNSW
jgi:hypothetical protein